MLVPVISTPNDEIVMILPAAPKVSVPLLVLVSIDNEFTAKLPAVLLRLPATLKLVVAELLPVASAENVVKRTRLPPLSCAKPVPVASLTVAKPRMLLVAAEGVEVKKLVPAADLSMSLDNVLAVAGAARNHVVVLAIGLVLSIGLMGVAANMIARVLSRHPWISFAGLFIVLYVALSMIWRGGYMIMHAVPG